MNICDEVYHWVRVMSSEGHISYKMFSEGQITNDYVYVFDDIWDGFHVLILFSGLYKCCLLLCVFLPVVGCLVNAERFVDIFAFETYWCLQLIHHFKGNAELFVPGALYWTTQLLFSAKDNTKCKEQPPSKSCKSCKNALFYWCLCMHTCIQSAIESRRTVKPFK